MNKRACTLLAVVLILTPGCFITSAWKVPTKAARAHTIETDLLVSYHYDANAFVHGLILDFEMVSDERDKALNVPVEEQDSAQVANTLRVRWAELNENYALAMQIRTAFAAWLGLVGKVEEVINAGTD